MSFPLSSKRLTIAPLKLADLSAFVLYRKDPLIARYQSWEPSYSEAQGRALIEAQIGVMHPENGKWLQLAIHLKEGGELIGDLALYSPVEDADCFELGFTISRNHQGNGYAKEAAEALLIHLFAECGAKRIVAHTDHRNAPSIKLLLGLGFTQVQSKSWVESFKNEIVAVEYFQASPPGQ